MNFIKYMEKCKTDPRAYAAVKDEVNLRFKDGVLDIHLSPRLTKVIPHDNYFEVMEFFLTTRVFGDGPKVFTPSSEQLKLLGEMMLNVPFSEYTQPFETVVIEFPDDFQDTHIIDEVDLGIKQRPLFSILHRAGDWIVHSVYMDSFNTIKSYWAPDPSLEMEEWLMKDYDRTGGSVHASDDEVELEKGIRRIVTTFMLLIDEIGCRKVGPAQPNRYAVWEKSARKRPELGTRELMKSHPMLYEFDRSVVLHRTVESHSQLGEPSGRHVGPHHRRGHYRMQSHGPKNSLRKRVRVPPVFVNKHLFLGNAADARVTYTGG